MAANSIAIVMNSFDGYSDLWDIFWDIFDKYAPDCPYKKYSISNEKEYLRSGVNNIKVGKEISWFERTKIATKQIEEEYFVFFLEDYFPSKQIDFNEINHIVKRMKEDNVFYYRLSLRADLPNNESFVEMSDKSDYPISLQLAIWKTDMFDKIICELHADGCTSPWDFEKYLKNNYKYCPPKNGKLQGIRFDTRDIMGYKNGVLRGKWFPDVRKFYMQQDIDFSKSKREILSFSQHLRYKAICFISAHFSKRSKERLGIMLKKIGIKNTI